MEEMRPRPTALLSLAGLGLLLLLCLSASVLWIGKIHFVDLPNYQEYVVNTYRSTRFVGHAFPVVPVVTVPGDTVYTDFADVKGSIVLLFNPSTCQPCLDWILNALEHIHNNLEDPRLLPIYAITNAGHSVASQYARVFKMQYVVGNLLRNESMDRFFDQTPLVLLISAKSTILQCHHPLQGKNQYTALFFQNLVFERFPSLQVNIEGFADSPLKKLHGLSLVDVVRGQYRFGTPLF